MHKHKFGALRHDNAPKLSKTISTAGSHIPLHTKLTPMLPLLLIDYMTLGTGIGTGTSQLGGSCNGEFILTLVLLLGSGETTCSIVIGATT